MDRIWKSGASGTPPVAPAVPSVGYPTQGNPVAGVPATTPGAWWFHMITEELRNVIIEAGLEPAAGDVGQLAEAIGMLTTQLASIAETQAGSSSTKAVSPAGLAASMLGGSGQSWQDVSGSRSLGTTYTNTTGRPIALSLRSGAINSSFVNVTVGGVLIARRWGGETWAPEIPLFVIVPPGATYVVTGSHALVLWCELR